MPENPGLRKLLAEQWDLAKNLRTLQIELDAERCKGVWQCIEVCPVGCWREDPNQHKAIFINKERCIVCGACVLQCPEKAISLKPTRNKNWRTKNHA